MIASRFGLSAFRSRRATPGAIDSESTHTSATSRQYSGSVRRCAIASGGRVIVIADKDAAGRGHAHDVAASCADKAASVKVLELPGDHVKDAADWLSAGGTKAELARIAGAAPAWQPGGLSALTALSAQPKTRPDSASWPEPPDQVAYHGLAGEFVRLVSPRSESDPVALLAQFLIAYGSMIGRSGHFTVENSRHFTNLFAVLVGETSKARKGTSWAPIRFLFRTIDDTWPLSSGLSSGEGLIWAVRDPIVKQEAVKEKHRVIRYEQVEVDAGIADKRLLVFQPEFASVLHVMERDGNTLSTLIRQAWDDGDLNIMTKNTPAHATDAHISLIGHVTRDELVRYLDRTEMANGFANRIAWLCVKRSKSLPEGGDIESVNLSPLIGELRQAVTFARQRGQAQVRRDDDARALWREVYGTLSEGRPGMIGAITSRAEAQVMRFALVYAMLDQSEKILRVHLEAALAFWRYAEASAEFIFGESLGDPDADTLLGALRATSDSLTRDQIRDLFGRHRRSAQVERILAKLVGLGLAHMEHEQTGGRPAERWYASAR